MDTLRYAAALVVWTAVPPTLVYWYLIHPLAGYWRDVGRTRTLMVVFPICLLLLGAMLRWSGPVASSDMGQNFAAFYSGLILFSGAVLADRRIRRDLGSRTLAGPTELEPGGWPGPPEIPTAEEEPDVVTGGEPEPVEDVGIQREVSSGAGGNILVRDGVYGRVRHPRYAAVTVGTLGLALVSHHAAAYLMVLLMTPLILVLARLEEAALIRRFGGAYLEYRDTVRAFVPRIHPAGDG